MPQILVIESNPRALCEWISKSIGKDFGTLYANVLTSLRGDVTTRILAPYDGETGGHSDGI